MARDYYDLLGVERDADAETIKLAFRALARELHPDVSEDAEGGKRFREVSEAYAVLSQEESRGLYDRLGWRGRGQGLSPRRESARVYASNPRVFLKDLESVLAGAVGGHADQPARVVAEVELDPYEAHVGATRQVEVSEREDCPACSGSGRQRVPDERVAGRYLALDDCPDCDGIGAVGGERPVEVAIPPGVRDFDRILVGPEEVAIVRIVRPRDRIAVRLAAAVALLAALCFLLFLLAL